ncbi:1439_t:CDS:2 [Funneliformis mosseae]|uniref:1439_t:CDS:1 n=1 Tax=Funneliformis mosseae TaxID=27381 RepID=A0A9N9GXD0_FUNMO|nr:1439_t:CDS:2 [Funneliformis mosseae]
MSNKRGRRSNKIWDYFEEGPKRNTSHKAAICNYCKKNILSISEQMSSSIPSITNIPIITPLRLQQIQSEANLIQSSINNYADKPFSTHRKKAIYKQISCAVASANLPFSFVDDPEVKKLFALFNSYFKLPFRKWLSTDIIEDLNNDVVIEIQNFITNSRFITLSGDGWTSQTRNNIMNYVLVDEN